MPDRDLFARVEYEPIEGSELELARTWLGPILLQQVPVGPETRARPQRFAERLNGLIDARVSELLAANNAEVERRRAAEDRAEALYEDWQAAQDWYRQHEKAIRGGGVDWAPDFMVPF